MISDKSIISNLSKIGKNVNIGEFSIIDDYVEIDDDNYIAPHTIIKGPTTIGKGNIFFQFASIGEECQVIHTKKKKNKLVIGNNNIFREGVTVHRSSSDITETVIGSNNFFMVNSHIAHDCIIGNNTIFANEASIAGHVVVGDYVNLGGKVGIHQRCRIGEHCFLSGGTILFKDVLPYTIVSGNPARTYGINHIGLRRNNINQKTINIIDKAYRIIFNDFLVTNAAIKKLMSISKDNTCVEKMIECLIKSTRGIVR